MDVKINQVTSAQPIQEAQKVTEANGDFKFILSSRISDADLQAHLTSLMEEITMQGERISKKKDIKDMRRYRSLIKEFMNEVVSRSHSFSRENFLDRRGRHRVYGIVRLVDEEKDNLTILAKIGDIRGLILDIFT